VANNIGQWVCCQLGAREHYAIPRVLFNRQLLAHLLTDAWVRPGTVLGAFGNGLAGRFHDGLSQGPVQSWNWRLLTFEMQARGRGLSGWPLIIARNRWFQRRAMAFLRENLESLNAPVPAIFCFSYAAREIFEFAKHRGWKTVLGQIDPGPVEEQAVAKEVGCRPTLAGYWNTPPAEYWDDWRKECDLADRIIVNSLWSKACLAEADVDDSKLIVVPLAYEMPVISDRRSGMGWERLYPDRFTDERRLRVLFLGQINLRKGMARILDAVRLLESEPIEFDFVGPIQITIPPEIASHPKLRWLGPVPRSQTAKFYRNADIFLFPTLSDGFGLTQLEAMAHKLPVIASRRCGSVVRDGVNGWVLEEPTPEAIANALRFCISNPERLRALSTAAKVEERYSLNDLADSFQALTQNLSKT
jgi:glycosyltransferase involved in cell wall biosynthesis